MKKVYLAGRPSCVLFVLLLIAVPRVWAAEKEAKALLPEGVTGIASKYPGDKGIEKDPDVIFCEKFDKGSVADASDYWDNVKGGEIMKLSNRFPEGSADDQSLLITHVGGEGTGGHLYRRLLPGFETVFARFYVKFAEDCAPIHHMGTHLGGYSPATRWPQGAAGLKPDGSNRFTSGVEPYGKKWEWDFYTYWQGMPVHGDGKYWGTPFLAGGRARPKVERGKWICVEMMIKLNKETRKRDGEQAFWLDGKLVRYEDQVVSHVGRGFPKGRWMGGWWRPDVTSKDAFDGFRWRTAKHLSVNYVWAYVYITEAEKGHKSKVWFDNIVVAKKYIGPLKPFKESEPLRKDPAKKSGPFEGAESPKEKSLFAPD